MSFFGMMYGYGKDGSVKQIMSVNDIDLAKPRWARYKFQGNWSVKSTPDAMIECYENVGPNGERVVALVTESPDYDTANDRILQFFVDAAVWFSSATVNPATAPVVAAAAGAAVAAAAMSSATALGVNASGQTASQTQEPNVDQSQSGSASGASGDAGGSAGGVGVSGSS